MSTALSLITDSLKQQGFTHCYGITGFPVIELSVAIQTSGIQYYGFRNEQGAAYAAGVDGYLTGRPGLCLTVSGPGFTNALSGVINAKENSWPMVLLSGSSETWSVGMNAFQEFPQTETTQGFFKWSVRITSLSMIPRAIYRAVHVSINGRPGPVYIDLPADVLRLTTDASIPIDLPRAISVKPHPSPKDIEKAAALIKNAKNPLVIIGKGTGYGQAEEQVNKLISNCQLPFLATPMGRGVVSDSSNCCVNAARSAALKNADVILLLGARLNWILHYGMPPRFNPKVKFINVNLDSEEINNNVHSEVALLADVQTATAGLIEQLQGWKYTETAFWEKLNLKIQENTKMTDKMMQESKFNFYHSLSAINEALPKDCILVCEGSNTMDIARTVINSSKARRRIDAGSWGTMGVAIPACFSAKVLNPALPVVAVVGDASFGFSSMELDTCARFLDDLTILIVNNNGIGMGVEELPKNSNEMMPNYLDPNCKYELFADAFGGKGYCVRTLQELKEILPTVFNTKGLKIVNIKIDPYSGKKPQEHFWLSTTDPKL